MNPLYFISESPKNFIFQKNSNKTNFGGFITLIYLIILILIAVSYIYDYYSLGVKFEIRSFIKYISEEEELNKIRNSEEFNHEMTITFGIFQGDELDIDKYIITTREFIMLDFGRWYKGKIDNAEFFIGYKCQDENCALPPDDIRKFRTPPEFDLAYYDKIIDYEDKYNPVKEELRVYRNFFNLPDMKLVSLSWEYTNFEEEKGIFSRISDNIFHRPKNHNLISLKQKQEILISDSVFNQPLPCYDFDGNILYYFKPTAFYMIQNDSNQINMIKRKEISFLDYISNIAALGMSIYNIISLCFNISYSKNFDNYKVLENILLKESKKIIKLEDLNPNISYDKTKEYKNFEDNILYKSDDNFQNENLIINKIEDINLNQEIEKENNNIEIKLPKLKFWDFLLNNIYLKCCPFKKKQKLIDTSNEILYKYFSVENIIYNQIKFECLMKDYQ